MFNSHDVINFLTISNKIKDILIDLNYDILGIEHYNYHGIEGLHPLEENGEVIGVLVDFSIDEYWAYGGHDLLYFQLPVTLDTLNLELADAITVTNKCFSDKEEERKEQERIWREKEDLRRQRDKEEWEKEQYLRLKEKFG